VIIIISLVFAFLIFPLFLNSYFYFSIEERRLFFSFNLYKVLKLFGGYCELIDYGVAVHLTKYKAIIIDKSSIFNMRKKIKPLKDYHIIEFESKIEFGLYENLIKSLEIGFILNYIYETVKWVLLNKRPYVKLNNDISVVEDKTMLNITIKCTIVLNLLMILLSLFKILVEKVVYGIAARKQQNSKYN
jgi:hypothetical protein